MRRYYIVDALRAVLAMCVAIGHIGVFPLFGVVGQSDHYFDFLARAWRTIVFGPPAVIVFFVISGFCIHLPFAVSGRPVPFLRFYARRYLRILLPLIVVVALYEFIWPNSVVFGKDSILWHSTLWSIVCEEIYYAAYPFLYRLRAHLGWSLILVIAFCTAAIVDLAYFAATDWSQLGIINTTIVLYPVWLLGCQLAERVSSMKAGCSGYAIWAWRICAWGVMWAAGVLHFHSPVHQIQSGVFVGVVAYFWLRAELSRERDKAPWALMIWAGSWSYSLYLVHPIVFGIISWYAITRSPQLTWSVVFCAVLVASYLFYLLIERPSHGLARKVPLFDASKQPIQPQWSDA